MLHPVPPTLQQATTDPQLWQRFPDTHGQVWVSLLWGHCFFLLGPLLHKVLFVPPKSLFPQSCVSSGGSMVGLMGTSSKKAYAIPRSAAPRAPTTAAGHCWPVPPQEMLTQGQVWLSLCGVSWCAQDFVWAFQVSLVGMGFDSKHDFTPPTVLLGLLLCPWTGIFLVGSNILLMMAVQQKVVILEFLQEKMSSHPSTLSS